MKIIATGMLVLMAIIYVTSKSYEAVHPAIGFVRAFAEAAMVGGLADWFAVTALFRHPMGLPIPHTAIIPRNKDRIGDTLANFLKDNFLISRLVAQRMRNVDLAGGIGRFLQSPSGGEGRLKFGASRLLGDAIASLDKDRLGTMFKGAVKKQAVKLDIATPLGQILEAVMAENRHGPLIDSSIRWAYRTLDTNEMVIRNIVTDRANAVMRWTGLDAGSPFDYRRNGILYVAAHLPAPGREGPSPAAEEELVDLITAAGGRTLGLFSSMRAAKAAAELLRERLDTPVLCQGEDSTANLVATFADDEETTLVGTLSLWQGVDVPGRTLSLVVIDRIPFPRPDDPLLSARQRAVAARGGNGFLAVAGNHAALLLAQGVGRLLRRTEDRGVVAVLDSRLVTARYGGYLRASLPPFWQTTDKDVVTGALERLRDA